jgi:hypothetical protein
MRTTISVRRNTFFASLMIFGVLLGVLNVSNNSYAQQTEDEKALMEQDKQAKSDEERGVPSSGLQISPTKFVWTLKEGETKTERINVKNYSDISQNVTVEVEDFFVGSDGAEPKFFVPDENHPRKARDIIDWITPPEDFTLAPDEAKWVDFTIAVPEGQPTNGYYGGILFKTGGGTSEEGSKIGISYRVGSLVIMAVQGDAPMKIDAVLHEFYSAKSIYWDSPAMVTAKVENTGNIHFPMFGEIVFKKFDEKFHVRELKPHLLYPDIPREYTEQMMFGIWDFGKYSATMEMDSEDGSVHLADQTEFYVIPWKGLVVIFSSIILLIIIIVLFKKYVHIGKKPSKK